MKIANYTALGAIAALVFTNSGLSASLGDTAPVRANIVVTVLPKHGNNPPETLGADDLAVVIGRNLVGNSRARVTATQPLTGDLAAMQLFVLLDDSTRSSSLGVQLPDLKAFLESLPASAEVAVGYMRNGTAALAQPFTSDHLKAAAALRLPLSIPGGNGSPYFALSDLVKRWPSKESTGRRVVLMLTDGVDRYYDNATADDPYVDAAIHDAAKQGVMVYSIYLRDSGFFDRTSQTTLFAQSRLDEVSQETGGHAYFQDFTDPVSIQPFLKDFKNRLSHQYRVTVEAFNGKGVQPVEVRSELPGVTIQGPKRIYLP
jgi:hypothetical protein